MNSTFAGREDFYVSIFFYEQIALVLVQKHDTQARV